jgi:hypothetical protein
MARRHIPPELRRRTWTEGSVWDLLVVADLLPYRFASPFADLGMSARERRALRHEEELLRTTDIAYILPQPATPRRPSQPWLSVRTKRGGHSNCPSSATPSLSIVPTVAAYVAWLSRLPRRLPAARAAGSPCPGFGANQKGTQMAHFTSENAAEHGRRGGQQSHQRGEEQFAQLVLSNPSAAERVTHLIQQGHRLGLALRVIKVADHLNGGGR